jgi:RES domain-containing protein
MPSGFRILKAHRVASAFDGEGARLFGGRWNSPGTRMVYTAESRSLAALELLVHVRGAELLAAFVSIEAEFAPRLVRAVDPASLPEGWRSYPAPAALQQVGDRWVARRESAVLRVPSAVMPGESNYLLAPEHPDFARIAIGSPVAFGFDARLAKR